MKKIVILGAVMLIISGIQISCSSSKPGNTVEVPEVTKEKLQILVEDFPPFSMKTDNKLSGFSVDLLNIIIEKLNLDVTLEFEPWAMSYQKSLKEPGIVLGSVFRTKKREELFNWIGPTAKDETFMFVKKGSKLVVGSQEDAKKLKEIGTNTDYYSEELLKEQGFTNLRSEPLPETTLKQLMSGEIDAAVFSYSDACQITKAAGYSINDLDPLYKLSSDEIYITISKGTSQKVVDEWQEAFDTIKTKGILSSLRQKWFPAQK